MQVAVAPTYCVVHNREVAVFDEDLEPGPGPVVVLVTVILLIVVLAILFYGLVSLHWFGFDLPASVSTTPTVVPPSPSASP